jgi:hypothetical protein
MEIKLIKKNNEYIFSINEENIKFNEIIKKYVFNLDIIKNNKILKTETLLSETKDKKDILKSTKIFLEFNLI